MRNDWDIAVRSGGLFVFEGGSKHRVCVRFVESRFAVDGDMVGLAKTDPVERSVTTSRDGLAICFGGNSGSSTKLGQDCGVGNTGGRWR